MSVVGVVDGQGLVKSPGQIVTEEKIVTKEKSKKTSASPAISTKLASSKQSKSSTWAVNLPNLLLTARLRHWTRNGRKGLIDCKTLLLARTFETVKVMPINSPPVGAVRST